MVNHRVIVAMSGGVDSSVTAVLLREKGYRVSGVTMKLLSDLEKDHPMLTTIEDACKVAAKLEIPHQVLNVKDNFQKSVINQFTQVYKTGKTPNPCIRCNRFIKFGFLLEKVKEMGADFLATGHYARIHYDESRRKYTLLKGYDNQKDQSYFLYTLKQEQLKSSLMPLGTRIKDEVREIAEKYKLPVLQKSESQEICFIQGNNYRDYLLDQNEVLTNEGTITDKLGNVLGKHTGIINYTIGQRRGLGVSAPEPLYVTQINTQNNTIVVGTRNEAYFQELTAHDVHWITESIVRPTTLYAKIRSLHKEARATVTPFAENSVHVLFEKPQWAITPGQAVVFYRGDQVVGGGTIGYGD
jgi:tRNA-specific 2-thiouridylase